MKYLAMHALILSSVLASGLGISYQMDYSSDVSPVQKVVEMMQKMVAQGKKEIQDEKLQYATYSQWAEMTKDKKSQAISDAEEKIESLQADIAKTDAAIEKLSTEMKSHQQDIDALSAEQSSITDVRKQEEADFKAAKKDYAESIDALSRAVLTLNKQAYDRKQASEQKEEEADALLEMSAFKKLSAKAPVHEVKEAVSAFLQQSQVQLPSKPKVDGYEFQSQGIITMLSGLQDKFSAEKVELEKAEFEKKASYETTLAGLQNEEAAEQKDFDKKSALKSKKLQKKAQLEDDLDTTQTTKAVDEKYLQEVSTTYDQKAADFESRQKLRAEELEAVNKAIEVMSTDDVMGNKKKHLVTSFLQVKSRTQTVLASLRSDGKQAANRHLKDKLVEFLQSEATRLHSGVLAKLVAPTANAQAMVNINEMLKSLLDKLQKEAVNEQNKKNYCDKELKTNKQTRAEKTSAVEELQADMDMLKASIKQLKEEVAAMTDDVTELDKSVANATEIRGKEKAKNSETVKDAQAAQAAVAQATSVLKEFYEKAGQATALVQEDSSKDSSLSFLQKSDQPPIFDSPYQGMGGESGGVVGMLEVIASDFAKLEADTTSEEEESQDEYDNFMKESRFNKKQMQTDIKHKKEKASEQSGDLDEKGTELESVQQELDASLEVYETLKDECINTAKSYEEQKRQREETIESLQHALQILNNNPV